LGNSEGLSFPEAFERKGKISLCRDIYKEFERCVQKALVNDQLFP
jgi:hypothetical protein